MSKKRKKMNTKVIEFGRKRFTSNMDPYGSEALSIVIDDWWRLNGYHWPARYPRSRRIEVLDWCSEHVPNAHINNDPGRCMLFKSEMIATMFKLTFAGDE